LQSKFTTSGANPSGETPFILFFVGQ